MSEHLLEADFGGPVYLDGYALDPKPSQQLWNHSPDGFAWGYSGSGPAQLALAVLLALGYADEEAIRLHQEFKRQIIARLPQTSFTIQFLAEGDDFRFVHEVVE